MPTDKVKLITFSVSYNVRANEIIVLWWYGCGTLWYSVRVVVPRIVGPATRVILYSTVISSIFNHLFYYNMITS